MNSLRIKLLVGFVVVAAAAVVVVAVVATQSTNSAFVDYVRQGQTQRLLRLQTQLVDYYARNQSWANVQGLLESSVGGFGRMGGMMGQGMGAGAMMEQQATIVADAQGAIVASIGVQRNNARLSAREMSAALPIQVDGRIAGYVLGQGQGLSTFSALEQDFVASVNRGLLLASLIAGILAVAASLLIARRLTAPVVSMTQAAQALARGDLSQRVDQSSGDEIGRLASAFNSMAASLGRAEQLRRNLVADVAHELRTPIAVLQADLEALQDGVYKPDAPRLAALREEVDLLGRLVADLQELSLAEAGQLKLERQPSDLLQICRQTVAVMEPQAAQRGVTLALSLGQTEAISVVDSGRIAQALRNLIANALRYTPAAGSVTVSCRAEGADNLLCVRDTGSGINPEDLPHIFDRFYRGEKSRARATGGAGLGLAIVRQLVEAHGGVVWAESTPGQGSAFYVRLPRA